MTYLLCKTFPKANLLVGTNITNKMFFFPAKYTAGAPKQVQHAHNVVRFL